jgi:type III restriction enzyme
MSYREFLTELSRAISLNISTIHSVFLRLQSDNLIDINQYLSHATIRVIKDKFNKYLLDTAISKFTIGFCKVSNTIHPTKLTDKNGDPLTEIPSQSIGNNLDDSREPSDHYLLNELFYDSGLELENMIEDIALVTVFTKIPKDSLRIPVAGGGSYSPDFAYIFEDKHGNKTLNFIIETKDKDKRTLYKEEEQKIEHAKLLFNSFGIGLNIKFETQFKTQKIADMIRSSMA